MIDRRALTVTVQILIDEWINTTGVNVDVDALEVLHERIEALAESSYKRGFESAVNPPQKKESE